jgi:hypothetical protein
MKIKTAPMAIIVLLIPAVIQVPLMLSVKEIIKELVLPVTQEKLVATLKLVLHPALPIHQLFLPLAGCVILKHSA